MRVRWDAGLYGVRMITPEAIIVYLQPGEGAWDVSWTAIKGGRRTQVLRGTLPWAACDAQLAIIPQNPYAGKQAEVVFHYRKAKLEGR